MLSWKFTNFQVYHFSIKAMCQQMHCTYCNVCTLKIEKITDGSNFSRYCDKYQIFNILIITEEDYILDRTRVFKNLNYYLCKEK